MRAAAERILPVSLELGGKAPAIVYPDSDDDATVAHVITAMRFARQGQSCTAGSRLFVHREHLRRLHARGSSSGSTQLVVGDALDERSDIGSIVSATQDGRVCGYVREALDQGATAIAGGLPDDGRPGYQMRPDRADRRRAVVARRARGGLRARARRAPLGRRGRGDRLGQRHPLRARGVRVLQGPRRARCAPRTGSRPAGCRSTAAAASCRA